MQTILNMKLIPLAILILFVASCASTPKNVDDTKDWTAEKFLQRAQSSLKGGDYESAITHFQKLEARYPFGKYAQQAQLETAYAYYKFEEPESAIAAADRFIKLHPRHPRVDYAYYLKGLASFSQENNPLENMVGKDPSQTNPDSARKSFEYFAELVKRFPNSKYANDAKKRIVFLRNTIAQHEITVANYYLTRKAYVASANRAKYVIEHYQRTPAMIDALVIMAKSYQHLGLDDLAKDTLRTLELNNPKHPELQAIKSKLTE